MIAPESGIPTETRATPSPSRDAPSSKAISNLPSRLLPLLLAQALGALNDNLLKTIVSLLLAGRAVSSSDGSFYMALTGAALVAPYLLFSGVAGYVSDRFPMSSVLVGSKLVELVIVALAVLVLWLDRAELMVACLFLMATQSAFFSPAKYGILPEMMQSVELPRANGLIEATRFLAVVLGTASGGFLLAMPDRRLLAIGTVLIAIAAIGLVASLCIAEVPKAHRAAQVRINPRHGLGLALAQRPLQFCILGISMLEFLGCLVLLDLILLTKTVLRLSDLKIGLLGTCLALGAAAGSYLCGRVSGGKARPALSLLAMIGAALAILALAAAHDVMVIAALIATVGACGGAALVPLYAMLQEQARPIERGQVIAANNFLNMVGVLIASLAIWLLCDITAIAPRTILVGSGVLLLLYTTVALRRWPEFGATPFRGAVSRIANPAPKA